VRPIHQQAFPHFLKLLDTQLGPIASFTVVTQSINTLLTIGSTPVYQTAPRTASQPLNLLHLELQTIHAKRLYPSSDRTIFGYLKSLSKFSFLFVCDAKVSDCHS
jgi:hypothetical protein